MKNISQKFMTQFAISVLMLVFSLYTSNVLYAQSPVLKKSDVDSTVTNTHLNSFDKPLGENQHRYNENHIPQPSASETILKTKDACTGVIPPAGYGIVSSSGKCWLDRNLGASRVATSSNDAQAYGDLYQWGRLTDGHEKRNSGRTSTLSNNDTPGHGNFITLSSSPYDWRNPQNNNLWQDASGINNPCPTGYRLPNEGDWETERQSWSSNDVVGAFNSPLKLTVAGGRIYNSSGTLVNVGNTGFYWSTTVNSMYARDLQISSSNAFMYSSDRAFGTSVRCLKVFSTPTVITSEISNITQTTASGGGNITDDGGALVTAYGVVFSTSVLPTVDNNEGITNDGTGTGVYSSLLTGLTTGTTYYVRAYATNIVGTAYGNEIIFETLGKGIPCPGATVVEDNDGNSYNTVLIGDQCWMKENLKVTKYRDGTSIEYPGIDNQSWESNVNGAYAWYNNDIGWKSTYGALYNWHAVSNNKGLCPNGWSVPSDADWTTLIDYTESNGEFGGKLKSASTNPSPHPRWNSPNSGATNEYSFTAIPGGLRSLNGSYSHFGNIGYYWSRTENIPSDGFYRMFRYDQSEIFRYSEPKLDGMSVRCIKNVSSWTGNSNSDWNNSSNWNGGQNPSQYDDVVINETINDPIVNLSPSSPAEVNSLTINPGASLTIAAGKALTVHGQLSNGAGSSALLLENDASLILNTNSISATISRQISGSEKFHMLGSPVAIINWGSPFTTPQLAHIWVKEYDEAAGNWLPIYSQDNVVLGKGYSIWLDETLSSVTANFTGNLHVADINPALTNNGSSGNIQYDGWNLLSNPFAAPLDWNHALWNRTNIDASVYTWNASSGNYVSWNGIAGTLSDGILPVAQGFFVKANGPSPSLTIPALARTHNAQSFYKNTASNVLTLNVSSEINDYSDETHIVFIPESTLDFDASFDAFKLFGDETAPQLYATLSNIKYSINAIPNISILPSINIGFEASLAGNYQLSAPNLSDFLSAQSVILTDLLLNTTQNLRTNPVYTFYASGNENPERFKISFGATSLDEQDTPPSIRLVYSEGAIIINNPNSLSGLMYLFDVTGKKIADFYIDGSTLQSFNFNLNAGVYLSGFSHQGSSYLNKIIVIK